MNMSFVVFIGICAFLWWVYFIYPKIELENQVNKACHLIDQSVKKDCKPLSLYMPENIIWQKSVIQELACLYLIIFEYIMFFDGVDEDKEKLVTQVTGGWLDTLTQLYDLNNTEQNRTKIKNNLNKKSKRYIPHLAENIKLAKSYYIFAHTSHLRPIAPNAPHLVSNPNSTDSEVYKEFLSFIHEYLENKMTSRPETTAERIDFIGFGKDILSTQTKVSVEISEFNLSKSLEPIPKKTNHIAETINSRTAWFVVSLHSFINNCFKFRQENGYEI